MEQGTQIQGIITSPDGQTIILLPAGPIRSKVEGASGQEYGQTLHDDPDLGRPTARLDPLPETGIIFQQ